MRRVIVGLALLAIVAIASGHISFAQAQGRGAGGATAPGAQAAAPAAASAGRGAPQAVFKLEDHFLEWRLLPSEKQYESIDGMKMLGYVKDQAAVSRRYRDAGHPQFWGRIIGSSADTENAQWLMAKYTALGLQDVHEEAIDLTPQWFPQSWDLTATSGDKTLKLTTAQPSYTSPGTTGAGLDLEVVYAGLGSEADLIGRDLRGKAVLIFSNPMPGSWRHTSTQETVTSDDGARESLLRLAQRRGAAAIICSIQLPPVVGMTGDAGEGNIRTQLYPTGTNVPTFSMGMKDGKDLRDMVAHAPSGQPVHLKLKMDVQQVAGLKTGTVWGTLPGHDRRDDLHRSAPRRMVPGRNRQRVRRRNTAWPCRVPREDSTGPASPHDHLPRHVGPSQQRHEQRRVAGGASRRAVQEDRAAHQPRTHRGSRAGTAW